MTPNKLASTLRQMATKIDQSERPDRMLLAQDLKRVLSSLRVAQEECLAETSAPKADVPAIEMALYNKSGPETDPDMQGSSIWWLVFNSIGMQDWTPVTDYAHVESEAKRLLAEWSKGWAKTFTPEQKQEMINSSLEQLKENWDDYQKSYMPEHLKILKEKGLM